MPLRSWIKICWSACLVDALLMSLSFFALFFNVGKANGDEYNFTLPGQKGNTAKSTACFDDYKFIWKAKINVKRMAPAVTMSRPSPKKPKLADDLQRYVVIKNIFTSRVGLIAIGGRDIQVAIPPNPIRPQKTNEEWKWQLRLLNGRAITVKQLIPQRGILFRSGAEEVLLKFTNKAKKKITKKNSKNGANISTSQIPRKVKLGENHWQISSQEGEELLNHYDKYVTELAPEPSNNPPGLLIRRVNSGSKAYDYGLRAEDVITNVNGVPIRSKQQIGELLNGSQQKRVVIKLLRNTPSGRRKKVEFIFEAH